jgi:hypothetical protein
VELADSKSGESATPDMSRRNNGAGWEIKLGLNQMGGSLKNF